MSTPETVTRTSRVGKRPIDLPKGVTAAIQGSKIEIKGPKGHLSRAIADKVAIQLDGDKLHVTSTATGSDAPRLQGLVRALVASMVKGVAEGYEKQLELRGTGYRAELKGTTVHLALGFSHPVAYPLPKVVSANIPPESKGTLIILSSPDKEMIGLAAAKIRGFRPPEPYGGKGVRYKGEHVREKAGKAGKGGKK
jgi:large subunit ribosomal protein L6